MAFNGKVLIIDDEAHIRKFIGLILRQLGNPTVIEASNGNEGLLKAETEEPDLILVDINMPILDGISMVRMLRQKDNDAVVVMLTSIPGRNMIEQALDLGVANYIRKDTTKEAILAELTRTINECFESE